MQSLVPNTITVYLTKQEYEGVGGVGTGAPVDNTKPFKPWRDNSLWYPSWFGGVSRREYNTFAMDNQGRLSLAPIDSNPFYYTYSDVAIRTYREWKHLFPAGVPVLIPLVISADEAGEFNYGSNGKFIPPPAFLPTNMMLAQAAPGGEWMAIDCQEWIKIQKQATQVSAEVKVEMIRGVCNKSIPAEDKLSEIRLLAQINPPAGMIS
jgi:hypothetical protein